jgi:DNA polymerase-3 subunit epsilon
MAFQPVFLDTETTGLGSGDQIVEICIIDSAGQPLVETLVRPTFPPPPDAVAIHGLSMDMLKDAPPWPEVWLLVEAALQGRYVGIYNADFDLRMMAQSHAAHRTAWTHAGLRNFCIMKMFTQFRGERKYISLENARRTSGIALPNSHRAKADALLAREVFYKIAGRRLG